MKTFEDYRAALDGASHDTEAITFPEFIRLVQIAYPETMFGGAA